MCIYFNIMWHQIKHKANTFGDNDPYPQFQKFTVSLSVFHFLPPKNIFCAGGFRLILDHLTETCCKIWKRKNHFCTFSPFICDFGCICTGLKFIAFVCHLTTVYKSMTDQWWQCIVPLIIAISGVESFITTIEQLQ